MTDEKNHRKVVGRRLQGRREREGWSREQVAEMSGLTVDTIRKVEEGAFNVPLDVLTKMAEVYGCEIYFMSFKKENKV